MGCSSNLQLYFQCCGISLASYPGYPPEGKALALGFAMKSLGIIVQLHVICGWNAQQIGQSSPVTVYCDLTVGTSATTVHFLHNCLVSRDLIGQGTPPGNRVLHGAQGAVTELQSETVHTKLGVLSLKCDLMIVNTDTR